LVLDVVHTGQHYDYELSRDFFNELGLPDPVVNLGVGSGPHGWQTGAYAD
jgi:UDP-N-acetylglucosamine 2-epimerase